MPTYSGIAMVSKRRSRQSTASYAEGKKTQYRKRIGPCDVVIFQRSASSKIKRSQHRAGNDYRWLAPVGTTGIESTIPFVAENNLNPTSIKTDYCKMVA